MRAPLVVAGLLSLSACAATPVATPEPCVLARCEGGGVMICMAPPGGRLPAVRDAGLCHKPATGGGDELDRIPATPGQ